MLIPVASIYLDTRRKKKQDRYPVKLRVYFNYESRYYSTPHNLTEDEFEKSYLAQKPRGEELKELKIKIAAIEAKANEVIGDLKVFSFERFEKKLLQPNGSGIDVFYQYDQVVAQLKKEERVSTASNYDLSCKAIKNFLSEEGRRTILHFDGITVQFLKEFEKWMLAKGKSSTTVGIYLRPLRAIFNTAIADGEIPADIYPFGKRKYQIPVGRNIKKALSKEDMKKLFEHSVEGNIFMSRARDFWFFSYICNGMNIRDIAELKYKNITDNSISFIRNKTKNTNRNNIKPIVAPLTPFAQKVIDTYGNPKINKDTYVFPILSEGISETEKVRLVQAFTRFINQHIKSLAKSAKINTDISTYWARHTFSTMAVHNGASLEFVQESLGHNSLMTTKNYFAGFTDNTKKEIADKLMDF